MSQLELFISFIKIGLLSFGGGYAAIPLIQQEVVTKNELLTLSQFSDLVVISSMTPGPIGLNTAIMSGIQVNGFMGSIIATLGFVIPSIIIMSIIGHFYFKYNTSNFLNSLIKGIKPAVTAFILSAGLTILLNAIFSQNIIAIQNINYLQVFFFILSLILFIKLKLSPIKGIMIILILSLISQFIINIS